MRDAYSPFWGRLHWNRHQTPNPVFLRNILALTLGTVVRVPEFEAADQPRRLGLQLRPIETIEAYYCETQSFPG